MTISKDIGDMMTVHSPADLAKTMDCDDPLLPRTYLLWFTVAVPCEHWSVNEIILCLIGIEDG